MAQNGTVISTPQGPASPDGAMVTSDDFYPDIDVNVLRQELRLNDTVTHDQLVPAVIGAILHVDGELADWRAQHEIEGLTSLAEISDRQIAGENRLELLFKRAVQFQAAAETWEIHRGLSATTEGQARSDDDQMSAAEYERQSILAIRLIKGVAPSAVTLL